MDPDLIQDLDLESELDPDYAPKSQSFFSVLSLKQIFEWGKNPSNDIKHLLHPAVRNSTPR
jgi:hypothetical protein